MKYTKAVLKEVRRRLAERDEADYFSVVRDLSVLYQAPINANGLECAFRRAGLATPRSFMKPNPLDPVDAYELVRSEREEKSQVKHLLEQLSQAKARQAFLDNVARGKVPVLPRMQKSAGPREMCGVVMMSDLHVEERVLPVEPFEEYTLAIAAKRLDKLFQGVVDLVKHHRADGHYLIDYLCLWLGGDFFTGYLHEDNVRTSQLSPTESILWLLPRINGGIRMLLKELDLAKIVIPCSFGNHGRTTAKPMIAAAPENSFEWLMYHTLAQQLADEPRVTFEITKSAHQYVQVYDYTLHFHHGDHVSYQGGILGPGVPFAKAVDAWNVAKKADYTHVGHYHTYGVFNWGIMNGAMIGYGPYSMSVKARKQPPAQAFYLLDSKRGMCMNTPIWL